MFRAKRFLAAIVITAFVIIVAIPYNCSAIVSSSTDSKFPGRAVDLHGRTVVLNVKEGNGTYSLPDPNTPEGKRVLEIEKKLNCKIKFYNSYNEAGGVNKITASVMAGKPLVDIWYQNGYLEFFPHYSAGLLQNLDAMKVIDFNDMNQWDNITKKYAQIKGVHYAVSTDRGTNASWAPWVQYNMFVNTKLLKQCGINDDLYALQKSGKWTWDKFEKICKAISQSTYIKGHSDTCAYFDGDSNLYNILLRSYDTDWMMRDSQGMLTFTGGAAKSKQILQKYIQWVQNKYLVVPAKAQAYGGFFGLNGKFAFNKGQAVFSAAYQYLLTWGQMDASVKNDVLILMTPKMDEKSIYKASADVGVSNAFYAIPYGVKKPAEVATILNLYFVPSKEVSELKDFYLKNVIEPTIPANTAKQSIDTIMTMWDNDYKGIQFDSVTGFKSFTKPPVDWMDHVLKIANGKEAMSSALDSVTTKYNALLSELGKTR